MTATSDAHVADSVEAAVAALEQLAASLRHGGFAEGAGAYQRMAEVLVAQRLFHGTDDAADPLVARFDHLGGLARQVFELLEPYAAAMRRLAAIAPDRPDTSTVAAIHAQLERRGRRGATASLLARAAHLPPDTAEQVLTALVADGTVVRRDVGEVTSYRLATPTPTRRPR
jgi:hypothetical protein